MILNFVMDTNLPSTHDMVYMQRTCRMTCESHEEMYVPVSYFCYQN